MNLSRSYTESVQQSSNTTADVFGASYFLGNGLTSRPRIVTRPGQRQRSGQGPELQLPALFRLFVEDGSYLKLKNITLGYTFPANWMSKIGIKSVRVYFACDNVFFASKRKGYDPRTSMGGQGATVA